MRALFSSFWRSLPVFDDVPKKPLTSGGKKLSEGAQVGLSVITGVIVGGPVSGIVT